jgi:ABC-2 type transport system ATP-binding protein
VDLIVAGTSPDMSESPLLLASAIHKSYGSIPALRGVDVQINAGEIVCLLGPNGAGKTTLTAVLTGLMAPDSGSAEINGIDVVRNPQRAHHYLGLAPQDTGVYPMLDVRTNLRLFCELSGLRGRAVTHRIEEIVDDLLLSNLISRRVQELSGGEKRRLHLAIALVHRPKLLILDEPSVGSDVATRRRLVSVVRGLASAGCGILYSTHYLGEVEELGGSVMILNGGTVVASGTVRDVLPRDDEAVVELAFSDSVPPLDEAALADISLGVTCRDEIMRIRTRHPGIAISRALSAIGPNVELLRSVNTVRPTLEDLVESLSSSSSEEIPLGGNAPS